jgi:hypothetical protein
MFRALAGHSKQEGFTDDNHFQFIDTQTTKFTETLPNMVLTNQTLSPNDPRNALVTIDPITRRPTAGSGRLDLSIYTTPFDGSKDLTDKLKFCRTTSLDDLINGPNELQAGYRCGWIYNERTGFSRGALGTSAGPAMKKDQGKGTWYWNLMDAKMRIEGKRCAGLVVCSNVDKYPRCGYDTVRGIGVPVKADGTAAYPTSLQYGAMGSLITNAASCPQPTAAQQALQLTSGAAGTGDRCAVRANGTVSRDCFLNTLTTAGCSKDGRLYQAIATSSGPNNYIGNLPERDSWKRFQRSATPFPEQLLKTGMMNEAYALAAFTTLKAATNDTAGTGFAARDLCLKSGEYDQFDFCTELLDSSPAPFALECLQREFRRRGGQPAGSAYPTAQNKAADWDTLGTWREVKAKIDDLVSKAQNTDRTVQRGGLLSLLGISPEADRAQVTTINGVEVMWFNRGTNSFIGRRIVTDKSAGFPYFLTTGIVEKTGLADNVEFFAVTNIRPTQTQQVRLRITADDGFVYVLNSRDDPRAYGLADNSSAFALNAPQNLNTRTANQCWTLQRGGPNYVVGFWFEQQYGAGHTIEVADCAPGTGAKFAAMPPSTLFLTQEPDAPLFSWEGTKSSTNKLDFNERRFPAMMNLGKTATTSVVTVANTPGFPYPAALQLRYGVGSSAAATTRYISAQGWRSLSIMFIPSVAAGPAQLIKFGPFTFIYSGNTGGFSWESGTLSIKNALMQNALVADGITPHYLHLCMRSDNPNLFPNRVLFACGPVSRWTNGQINLPSGSGANVLTFTSANGMPVFTAANATDQIILGDINGVLSANVRIGAVRLFDYELSQEDILRDVNNKWDMAFLSS